MKKSKLSNNQERYFLAEKFTDKSYALPVSYLIHGDLDINRFKSAISKVISFHDIFKLQITKEDDGEIIQKINDEATIDFDFWHETNASDEYIENKINNYFFSKNDILNVPLVKFQFIKLAHQKTIFTFSIHHIICDGISIELFLKDLSYSWAEPNQYELRSKSSFLECLSQNKLTFEPTNGENIFWRNYLKNGQETKLPPDKIASLQTKFVCSSATLESDLSEDLEKCSKSIGVSKFNIVYSAYNFLLSRYSGSEEVITTFQSAGRRMLDKADTVIGLFSNALILRTNFDSYQSFKEVCINTRHDVRNCLINERFPYHRIISESRLHPEYGFNWYPSSHEFSLEGLIVNKYGYTRWQSDYKMNLHCTESNAKISFDLHYDLSFFTEKRISLFLEQLVNIISQITNDINIKILDINLNTKFDYLLSNLSEKNLQEKRTNSKFIYDAFLEKSKLQPNRTALVYGKQTWTYGQLENISKVLSAHIESLKLPFIQKIAILSDRTPSLIISILSVLRWGRAFAVLDNSYPAARINEYLDVLKPDLLIDCTILGESSTVFEQHNAVQKIKIPHNLTTENFNFSGDKNFNFVQGSILNSTAYYLFTSGTTGKPKCVETSHSPLVHFVEWQIDLFSINKNDKVTLLSGLAHDPVLRDIFTTLSSGASLLIPENDFIYNPTYLYTWLSQSNPTILHITPQMCKLISGAFSKEEKLNSVRYFFTGGDFLTTEHVNKIINLSPQAKIVNFYGATETPQAVGYHVLDLNTKELRIPIGHGIKDVDLLILNKRGDRAGYGEVGQIVVRSEFLSKGYQSTNSTKADSLNNEYNTGDYGYFRDDGEIFLIGRLDDQVKIRGYRIELNDITNHLASLDGIIDAVSIALELDNGEQSLSSYLVKDESSSITIEDVRDKLSKILPSYMIPQYLTWIDAIPLLPNGKINRQNLPKPTEQKVSTTKYLKPETLEEKNLITKFESILQRKSISLNDTFVSLGGDSLSYVEASLALENAIGHVPEGWNTMTIKELANIQHKRSIFYDVSSPVVIRALSIILVVIGHFWFTAVTGATEALLLVAGYAFADFQLKSIKYAHNVKPIINSMFKIILPTLLYSIFMAFYLNNFHIEIILMYSNFIDPHLAGGAAYWFIEVLLQIMLIMLLVLHIDKFRILAIEQPYKFGMALLIIGLLLALSIPKIWDTTYLYNRVPHMKLWYFALGWVLFFSTSLKQKLTAMLLSLVIPMILSGKYHLAIMVIVPVVILLFIPKFKIISPIHKLIYLVAGASLFIYLTHFQFKSVLHNYLHIVNYPQIDVLFALLGGVFLWFCWGKFLNLLAQTKNKLTR